MNQIINIPESANKSVIAMLNFTDQDATSPNNVIEYKIEDSHNMSSHFAMEGSQLKLIKELDAETNPSNFTINVTAMDGGDPSMSSKPVAVQIFIDGKTIFSANLQFVMQKKTFFFIRIFSSNKN